MNEKLHIMTPIIDDVSISPKQTSNGHWIGDEWTFYFVQICCHIFIWQYHHPLSSKCIFYFLQICL